MALIFFSSWFFMTVLVDFVAVPTIFRTLPDIQWAGKLGIKIFSKFNIVELIFSSFILFYSFKDKSKLRKIISRSLVLIACVASFYITPKIIDLSEKMFNQKVQNINEIRKEHDFFHKFYVRLDSLKLLLLLVVMISMVREKKEES